MDGIIGIVILLVLLSMFGVSFSAITKGSKLPKWAKFNSNDNWGFPGTPICDWFDRNKWLKVILIRLAQLAIIITLFLLNFTLAVAKAFIKALGNGTKSVKKMLK